MLLRLGSVLRFTVSLTLTRKASNSPRALNMRLVSVAAVLLSMATTATWAHDKYSALDITDGQRLFNGFCAWCHGPEGDWVPQIDLGRGKVKGDPSDAGLMATIRKGIPGTAMPEHPDFTDPEIRAIVAYLRSIGADRESEIPGDVAEGRKFFEGRGECLSCHRVMGKGSRVGPDLTDMGVLRRYVEIERSILEPDAEVLPEYRSVRVVTRTGEVISGRILNRDTFSVQMIDTRERLRSLKIAELREVQISEKSPMPSWKEKLSPQELANLVRYIVSLKGVPAR